ncbi:unnamed protein product [Acanthoscelides obtectus]|uniref:Endonuclease/exonuclease/phosphatase domain-containing protein n=1 Tax=Acanthoscelides obtectus TaxID=200917 RepID=A0A9P0PGD4_ACAOB|nr:unnamed protein product [Acanthoscelides obtectus]CAK1649510.1 hypothetical protein AOBTE_LOCUS16283 [Acanthoscelides obtectus]
MLNSSFPLIDTVDVKVNLQIKPLIAFCIYVPPSVGLDEFECYLDGLETILTTFGNYNIVINGGFNVPSFNIQFNDRKFQSLSQFCAFSDLTNFNSIVNCNGRLLDLVLTNFNILVIRDCYPLVKEDKYHPALQFNFTVGSMKNNFNLKTDSRYNFRRARFEY